MHCKVVINLELVYLLHFVHYAERVLSLTNNVGDTGLVQFVGRYLLFAPSYTSREALELLPAATGPDCWSLCYRLYVYFLWL